MLLEWGRRGSTPNSAGAASHGPIFPILRFLGFLVRIHGLEPVPVWVVEVDAPVIAGTSEHGGAVAFQVRLYFFVRARFYPKGHVVHVIARFDVGALANLEQGDHLPAAAPEKGVGGVFVVDGHSQHVEIEFPRLGQSLTCNTVWPIRRRRDQDARVSRLISYRSSTVKRRDAKPIGMEWLRPRDSASH